MRSSGLPALLLVGATAAVFTAAPSALAAPPAAPGGPDTQIAANVRVGDTPQSVAVNATTDTIYVGNSNSGVGTPTLSVVNGHTNKVAATIQLGQVALKGLAVDPDTNRLFVLEPSRFVVINGQTNKVVASHVFNGAVESYFGISDDPRTGLLYFSVSVGPNNQGYLYVIKASTAKVVAHIPVAAGSGEVKANPQTNRIYTLIGGSNGVVAVVNGATRKVITTISLGSKSFPTDLAVDQRTNGVYVVDNYGIVVINGSSNTISGTITDGDQADQAYAIAVNGVTGYFYTADDADNNVGIYSVKSQSEVGLAEDASQDNGPVAAVADSTTNTTYVVNQDANTLTVLVPASG